MEENALITAEQVTHLKQVEPEGIRQLSEKVMEADKLMTECTEELNDLSNSLYNLSATKDEYDEAAKKVKGQMRNLMPRL